jgi:hypothetical protein
MCAPDTGLTQAAASVQLCTAHLMDARVWLPVTRRRRWVSPYCLSSGLVNDQWLGSSSGLRQWPRLRACGMTIAPSERLAWGSTGRRAAGVSTQRWYATVVISLDLSCRKRGCARNYAHSGVPQLAVRHAGLRWQQLKASRQRAYTHRLGTELRANSRACTDCHIHEMTHISSLRPHTCYDC